MRELCTSPLERSRKAYSRVLQSLQEPGRQVALAVALGVSESTISRVKNERLEECLALLYCAGFKVVPSDRVGIDPEALTFMCQTTARMLSDEELVRQFIFRDDE